MSIVADVASVVVGADTHRDTHSLEIVTSTGATVARTEIANTTTGFADALAWITAHAPEQDPASIVAGIEGSRSYGIGLARALTAAGYRVGEISRIRRADPRRGKSDRIDAHTIAVTTLNTSLDQLATPRSDSDREALRILLTARDQLTTSHTAATNQLKALLLTGDDTDRDLARQDMTLARLTPLTRRRGRTGESPHARIRRLELARLAGWLLHTHTQLRDNRANLVEILDQLTPGLTDAPGIGPVTAATAVVAYSHPGRVRDDAAFASLAGTCPTPASSGKTTRHRLNRGGDRALNRAIHTIVLTRWRCCPHTQNYITRRRNEGKTDREIRRALKRYVTRELYRTIHATMNT